MSQARLNHTLFLYIHKDRTHKINDMTIAKEFITENNRSYFGSIITLCYVRESVVTNVVYI